jgi:2-polyprenyl-3-methyl-5-hydroxy-6-metoxy-1,4-benzoquinol methylase
MTIQGKVEEIASRSQYGWGHTIRFGDFTAKGFLDELYLGIVEHLDSYNWLPADLSGLRVADVGCFSGGITKIIAERKAEIVYAVDEVPAHLEQCELVKEYFNLTNVEPIESSLYRLNDNIEKESLDLIICSGVLYHCSDMLTAFLTLRDLLKPSGVLLIESTAVNDMERSYANFARFIAGAWWVPTSLCISDMLSFMGFETPDIRFYTESRCLVKAIKSNKPIAFKRGLNFGFDDISDGEKRTMSVATLRPARD